MPWSQTFGYRFFRLGASVTTIEMGKEMSKMELQARIAAMQAELDAREGQQLSQDENRRSWPA